MKISAIIVNFNTQKLLKACLRSIFAKTQGLKFEVIVVDNASNDGSQKMVKKDFPRVLLLENEKNLGFAAGNNLGLKKAKGEYFLLLNSDTQLVENSLLKMVEVMEKNPKVGIASCQLVGKRGEIQPSGGFFPHLSRVFAWMFFLDDLPFLSRWIKPFHPHPPHFYTRDPWYRQSHFQDWVTGAFFLIRKKVQEQIGFLDEKFFMYVEEMEYCYRAKKAGWQVAYTPETKIIHLGGKSGSARNAFLGEYRGLKYFYQKHKSSQQRLPLRFFLKAGALLRVFFFGIIKGDSNLKETYVEAFRLA